MEDYGLDHIEDTGNKKQVFIKTNFMKLSEINTLKEEFLADVHVQIRWREPGLDHVSDGTEVDFSHFWNPKISINNTKPGVYVLTTTNLSHAGNGDAYIVERWRVKGLFSGSLDLQDFPFDIQHLAVVVSSQHPRDEVEILEDEEELSAVNVDCFVRNTEWNMMDLVYTEPLTTRSCASRDFVDLLYSNPGLSAKCITKRRAGFYMYNTVLIMALISSLSLATFAVDELSTSNRLALSFIIMLTGVTFKTVTNRSLPKIPYLTHLDHYIIGSMVLGWFVCIWHAVVSLVSDGYRSFLDFVAFVVFASLFVVFHIIFFAVVLAQRFIQGYRAQAIKQKYQRKALLLGFPSGKKPQRGRRTV